MKSIHREFLQALLKTISTTNGEGSIFSHNDTTFTNICIWIKSQMKHIYYTIHASHPSFNISGDSLPHFSPAFHSEWKKENKVSSSKFENWKSAPLPSSPWRKCCSNLLASPSCVPSFQTVTKQSMPKVPQIRRWREWTANPRTCIHMPVCEITIQVVFLFGIYK